MSGLSVIALPNEASAKRDATVKASWRCWGRAPASIVMHRGWSVTRGAIDWCGRNRGHISNTRSDPRWWGFEMEGAEMELQ